MCIVLLVFAGIDSYRFLRLEKAYGMVTEGCRANVVYDNFGLLGRRSESGLYVKMEYGTAFMRYVFFINRSTHRVTNKVRIHALTNR